LSPNELLQGKYGSANEAALACIPELARQQQSSKSGAEPAVPRSLNAVTRRIVHLVRVRRQVWPGAWWSKQEDDVARPFAKALAEGRYSGSTTAARACQRELLRLHKLHRSLPLARPAHPNRDCGPSDDPGRRVRMDRAQANVAA
jgi:hypothetical protein